jgi:MFS family permease
MVRWRRRRRDVLGAPLRPAVAAALVFLTMLSSTLLIPAVRPFFAAVHPEHEGGLFLFMSVNMLGAVVGGPLLAWAADASGKRSLVLLLAAVVDGALLFLCSLGLPLPLVLALRALQGMANVGALSVLMGLTSERGLPVVGGATIAAIAAGAPLGTLLLGRDPAWPLQVGAMLPLVVAAAVAALQPGLEKPRARTSIAVGFRMVLVPGAFVFAERAAIGLFIVPFSLLCHERGLADDVTGRLFAAFLIPFAVVTALANRTGVGSAVSVVVGVVAYGAALFGVGRVEGVPLSSIVLLAGGTGAALVYAPALRVAARVASTEHRAAAMGALNAMGALGMLLGSGAAGFITRGLAAGGASRAASLTGAFDVAAGGLILLGLIFIVPFARVAKRIDDDDDDDDDDDGL